MLSRSKKIKTEIQKQTNTIRGGKATERMTHKYSKDLRNQLLKELRKPTDSDESKMIRKLLARQAEEQKAWRFTGKFLRVAVTVSLWIHGNKFQQLIDARTYFLLAHVKVLLILQ